MPENIKTAPGDLRPDQVAASDLAIGVDFGGSGIKGAVVDIRNGKLVGDRLRFATPQPSRPMDVIAVTKDLVERLVAPWSAADASGFAVGFGVPSPVRNGVTTTAANIDKEWIGFAAERELAGVTGRRVTVGNDADVAGLAEVRFGAGRGRRGLTMVLTIGTGMGTALFIDGTLVPNLELGHLEMRGQDAESLVSEAARTRLNLSWKDWAVGFDEYLHMLERLFYPDLFIFGGGASKRADNYRPFLTIGTPIELATFRNNAGIVGSAIEAFEHAKRPAAAAD